MFDVQIGDNLPRVFHCFHASSVCSAKILYACTNIRFPRRETYGGERRRSRRNDRGRRVSPRTIRFKSQWRGILDNSLYEYRASRVTREKMASFILQFGRNGYSSCNFCSSNFIIIGGRSGEEGGENCFL